MNNPKNQKSQEIDEFLKYKGFKLIGFRTHQVFKKDGTELSWYAFENNDYRLDIYKDILNNNKDYNYTANIELKNYPDDYLKQNEQEVKDICKNLGFEYNGLYFKKEGIYDTFSIGSIGLDNSKTIYSYNSLKFQSTDFKKIEQTLKNIIDKSIFIDIQANNKKFFNESLNKAIEKGVVKTSSDNNKKEWEK